MKVLLVRPKFSSIIANLEPLGLEYIGGILRDINLEYEIFDEFQHSGLFRQKRLEDKIRTGGYHSVGFNANANTTDYIINTANQLKAKFKNLYIMVGGPEAELNYSDFFVDCVDFIYHDNGLDSIKAAFECGFDTQMLSELTGLCYKENGKWITKEKCQPVNGFITKPDRNELYKHLDKNFIFLKGSFAIVKAAFSCPFNCSFCYCTKMNSNKYTERDIFEVIDEVEEIKADRIWFVDDTFCINKDRVKVFCEEILKRGIKKQFMAYSRADFLAENPDILPLMYRAGFRDILVGLEAVDDDLLDEYNKETSKRENEDAVKHLRESGITCNALFVVSHRSTKKDFKNLMKFIKQNKLLWVVFGIFTPYKGTDAYLEYKDRLINFKAERLDGLHITVKPEHMGSFMFMVRVYMLYVLTYPKIWFRTITKTAYDTNKHGWF